ncbi:MAG: YeeE/YedE family protein, partial [Xanthomonadales bacterium]|nr:YeeE/YedE family protein [Xanthomonadales bacterium]
AFGGGALMGVGAMLARGCTSGQALSGGAVLSVGSWVFMLALFASAYLIAPLLRRLWR